MAWATVVHAYNPSYSRGRNWKDEQFEESLGKKLVRSHLNKISQLSWYVLTVPTVVEA
jgi:hypothetical protein